MPSVAGASKVACKFFDELEVAIGVKIQHRHYDFASKKLIGNEHRPEQWQMKSVDGFYANPDGTLFAFEFLGDHFHGHPSLWIDNPLATDMFGRRFVDRFLQTEEKLQKLADLGYWVVYIWEKDYTNKPAFVSLPKVCRTFGGELLY